MGYVDAFDTVAVIAALEMTLAGQGYKFSSGAGVAAATKVFTDSMK
jgi:aspartate aminotransferase-like enzyme